MSVSVGQRIVAWGEFSTDTSMVATRLRMRMNQLTAQVVQSAPLAVDLFYLNSRRAHIYDFSGTGAMPEMDADPDHYEIDTGLLSLAGIADGDLVRVRGLVSPFGTAPADYVGRTVIDVQTDFRAALLHLGWREGASQPFSVVDPEVLEIDLAEARKTLRVRGVPAEYLEELESVSLSAPDNGRGVYAVTVRGLGEIHLFRNFADLVDELVAQLDAGRLLHRISAKGRYNVADEQLTTLRAGFVFSGFNQE